MVTPMNTSSSKCDCFSNSSTSLPTLDNVQLFHAHPFDECKMVSHCVNFHLSNYWSGWASFYMCYWSFKFSLLWIACSYLLPIFLLLHWCFLTNLILRGYMCCQYPSQFTFCLFTLPAVLSVEQSFKISCRQVHHFLIGNNPVEKAKFYLYPLRALLAGPEN